MFRIHRLACATAAAAALVTVLPAPAMAAAPTADPARLVAGPAPRIYTVAPGEGVVNETIEIRNDGPETVHGAVVHFEFPGQWTAGSYMNCVYPKAEQNNEAVCTFSRDLEPGATYRLGGGTFRMDPAAAVGTTAEFKHTWYSREYVDAQGPAFLGRDKMVSGFKTVMLIRKLAPAEVPAPAPGATNVGTGTVTVAVGTVPPPVTTPPVTTPAVTPPTRMPGTTETPPTTTPTTTPSTSAPATTGPTSSAPATTEPAGGTGGGSGSDNGGLPLTGTNVAVITGAGAALLAGGLAVYLLARRRRTSFSA